MEKEIKNYERRELRFVITQNCNYDCRFCHDEGMQKKEESLFSPQDYGFIFSVGDKYFNIKTATLTGGEPLVRKDAIDISKELHYNGAKTTLLTNGALLNDNSEIGRYVKRVNVSLHSLNRAEYTNIVQKQINFDKLLRGLYNFKDKNPDTDLKLNVALLSGINDSLDSVNQYMLLASDLGASVKYMELYPKNTEGFVNIEKLGGLLAELGFKETSSDSRNLRFKKGKQIVDLSKIFCSAAEDNGHPSEYCHENNDLFVNPSGSIKPCRVSDANVDIRNAVKSRDEKGLTRLIIEGFNLVGKNCGLENKMKGEIR